MLVLRKKIVFVNGNDRGKHLECEKSSYTMKSCKDVSLLVGKARTHTK